MKTSNAIALVLLTCIASFGQSTYKGLTPGQSTRAKVEVHGRCVKVNSGREP